MTMGSLASANHTGDKVDSQEIEEDSMETDKEGLPSPEKGDEDDGQVKLVGDEVQSREQDENKVVEDFKEKSEFPNERGEMQGKREVNDGDGEQVKSKGEVKLKDEEEVKTEDRASISAKKNDEEGEIVDVEDEEEEKNLEDCVNLTEMPTEGPQEIEEEHERKEELKDEESAPAPITETEESEDNQLDVDASQLSKINTSIVEEEERFEDKELDNQEVDESEEETTTITNSSSSKELQCEDVDEDVVEAMECIANHVSSEIIQDPAVTRPVIVETEEDEEDGIPIPVETTIEDEEATSPPCSPVPAPETEVPAQEIVVPAPEIVVPAPEIVVPAPETPSVPPSSPPVIEVDPEITLLKKEMDRLKAALIWERGSKAELSSKLKKSQEELQLKTKNLNTAENKLWERSTAVASLAERDIQLKTLQDSFDKLNEDNGELQRKYGKLQNSVRDIGKEFGGIYETLQNHFKICSANGPEMVALTPHEALQRRVDDLTTSVHERYKFWNAEQHKMGEELGETRKMMEELIEFLEVAEEKKPKPPPETADRATSPILSPSPLKPKPKQSKKKKKKEFKCNLCRNSFSNARILKRHRKSCRDAVAGTSSSSNPNTPAPVVNESDSDDIAIIEDESFDVPVSPPAAVTNDSNDDSLESPPTTATKTIPQPLSSPPIVMSKIALSFAPPIPPSSPSKKKRRSITVVHEVENDTSPSSPTAKHTRDSTKSHLGYFCTCGVKFRTRKRLDGHVLFQDGKLSEKPSSKKAVKVDEEISTPSSPPPTPSKSPSPPTSTSPPKMKKKNKKSKKPQTISHAVDPTNELACTCGKDFINKYHLKCHIDKETANPTTPPAEKSPKVAVVVAQASSPKKEGNRISHKINDEIEETRDKSKKRRLSVVSVVADAPESEELVEEETSLRSSKRLKKIKETAPATPEPVPSPRTRKQAGGGGSPKKKSKTADVPVGSPKKSPKKGVKAQDLSPKKVVHEQDHSKSARRGFFCKCGKTFQIRRKLNIHIHCRKGEEKEEEKEETGKVNGIGTFVCGSCGESFESNAERIKHRVQAHGHGLNN